jgi:hypothetical protein
MCNSQSKSFLSRIIYNVISQTGGHNLYFTFYLAPKYMNTTITALYCEGLFKQMNRRLIIHKKSGLE